MRIAAVALLVPLAMSCFRQTAHDTDGAVDSDGAADSSDDSDGGDSDDSVDCATGAGPGCDEACIALVDEAACLDNPTCRPYYGDRREEAEPCVERSRFAACRHFDMDVDLGVDNWALRGPDGACWLFNPGQYHPHFTSGCSFEQHFRGVADC